MQCPYCKTRAEWVENKEIYGRNYGKSYMAWLCRDCGAYVGCHCNTKKPLGTMANAELREYRKMCHAKFDLLWKNKPRIYRKYAYKWLQKKMNMSKKDAHIAKFNIDNCKELLRILELCEPINLVLCENI